MSSLEVNKIHNIDCLEFMKTLPDKCIDLVLTDPPYGIKFAGSGTLGVACKLDKRNYILNEISPEYCKIAEDRIKAISNPLF